VWRYRPPHPVIRSLEIVRLNQRGFFSHPKFNAGGRYLLSGRYLHTKKRVAANRVVTLRVFKYFVLDSGIYFNEKFSDTRFVANQNLVRPNVRTSQIVKSFFSNSLALWNKVSVTAKNYHSLSSFKSYLRNRHFYINR